MVLTKKAYKVVNIILIKEIAWFGENAKYDISKLQMPELNRLRSVNSFKELDII